MLCSPPCLCALCWHDIHMPDAEPDAQQLVSILLSFVYYAVCSEPDVTAKALGVLCEPSVLLT